MGEAQKKGQGGRGSDCDQRMVGHEVEKNPGARSTMGLFAMERSLDFTLKSTGNH